GLKGVSAYLYALNDWNWREPVIYACEDGNYEDEWYYQDPVITYAEDGEKVVSDPDTYLERKEMMPNPFAEKLRVNIGAGQELKVILSVVVSYESGSYNIIVNGVVVEHPETAREVKTETVIKEEEYVGFKVYAPVTEQTALPKENVDYYISIYNPSYYTDEILLELGGKDLNTEGVKAQLFMKKNVYYFEPCYGQLLRKDNTDFHIEFGGALYDPSYMSEKEIRERHPEFDKENLQWDAENGRERKENGNSYSSDPEEYYIDNSGAIYENYDYERENWEKPEYQFDEDEWLVPLPGDEKRITLGPFEEIWLVLRVVVEDQIGVFNIDLCAQSVPHPEYSRIVSTKTIIKENVNHGLELFIGDPVHYTAYGITTIYVFQLTNTGDIRDTVLLDIEGRDAFDPNVHIEIGVKGTTRKEPVILKDEYNNFILPYDDTAIHADKRYHYRQWAEDEDIDDVPLPGNENGEGYRKQLATIAGEVVDEDWHVQSPTGGESAIRLDDSAMWGEPVEYTYINWDASSSDSKNRLDEINYVGSGGAGKEDAGKVRPGEGTDTEYYDLDHGFIPY
ncbi:MAG: hypothetical protein KAU14_00385, partial [Thermoplasmata archaeon]|nr:hypothetical protein [Thermoplasmata archaeon]